MWNENKLTELLNKISYPIIQAPMAGGPTTPELIAAVSNNGGLGSLGAGYLTPQKLREEIKKTKELTDKPISVNIFVPEFPSDDTDQKEKIIELLKPYREELGLSEVPEISALQQSFDEQLNVIIEEGINILSFTFGIPLDDWIKRLKDENMILIGTATTVDEAIELENKGVDVVVAQGSESGGHRGTFKGKFENSLVGTIALVPQVVDNVSIPVIAAGGIMDARGIVASLVLGASGVQMGSAFLTCNESGAHDLHKKAILESKESDTVITKVFSGKMARGIRNKFVDEFTQYE
ncbi:MAG: NAD(P)H-dependent flavin oxidoreductase, partial [Thermodesulfobacteriota bacterium]